MSKGLGAWTAARFNKVPRRAKRRAGVRGGGKRISAVAVTAPKSGRPFVCVTSRRKGSTATMVCTPEKIICMGRTEAVRRGVLRGR